MTKISLASKLSEPSPTGSASGSRGRKAEQIYAAARQIFMESGYEAASMDAVAARAGVSKATIYVHFEGKQALFESIVRRHTETLFSQVELPEKTTDLRQALTILANSFVQMILTPDALSIYRVVAAEAARQPEIGEAFYAAGPAYARQKVADYFLSLLRRGMMRMTEAEAPILANLFLSMLSGDCHASAMFGRDQGKACLENQIRTAVDLVVSRYGV
jgi:TetR/AcrR family transcriptional repressor of mexJK operon